MTQNLPYSVEYVPPGIVRCGEYGITDYCLIYRETGVELYIACVGTRQPNGHISYRAALPPGIQGNAELYARWGIIVERLTAHLASTSYLRTMHHDTSFAL
jgi:hypothetical protein